MLKNSVRCTSCILKEKYSKEQTISKTHGVTYQQGAQNPVQRQKTIPCIFSVDARRPVDIQTKQSSSSAMGFTHQFADVGYWFGNVPYDSSMLEVFVKCLWLGLVDKSAKLTMDDAAKPCRYVLFWDSCWLQTESLGSSRCLGIFVDCLCNCLVCLNFSKAIWSSKLHRESTFGEILLTPLTAVYQACNGCIIECQISAIIRLTICQHPRYHGLHKLKVTNPVSFTSSTDKIHHNVYHARIRHQERGEVITLTITCVLCVASNKCILTVITL